MHSQFISEFALIIIFLCGPISSVDFYEGHDFGSRMSYKEVKKQGLLFFKRQETAVFDYPEGTNITGIACVDQSPNKKGKVEIVDGGLYTNHVKIFLESETSVGLKYIIEIYTTAYKIYSDPIKYKETIKHVVQMKPEKLVGQ